MRRVWRDCWAHADSGAAKAALASNAVKSLRFIGPLRDSAFAETLG